MKNIFTLCFSLIVVSSNYSNAATDMQCMNDCTNLGYQYQLCNQKCSYNNIGNSNSNSNTTIPMQGQLATQNQSLLNSIANPNLNIITSVIPQNQPQQQYQPQQQPQQQYQPQNISLPATPTFPLSGWENVGTDFDITIVYTNPNTIVKNGNLVSMCIC